MFTIIKKSIEKKVYMLCNIVVLLIGYLLIKEGLTPPESSLNPVYISIGTSLIAASIVAILDLYKNLTQENIFGKIKSVISESGIDYAFNKRNLDKYDSLVASAETSIDVTGYSLMAFYDSFADVILLKANKNKSLKVRLLLVDPTSLFSTHRAEIEGHDHAVFVSQLKRIRTKFTGVNNIELRLINSPLTTMIFRIDNHMFVGPYLFKRPSKSTITLEIRRDGWLFPVYENEFDQLWADATLP